MRKAILRQVTFWATVLLTGCGGGSGGGNPVTAGSVSSDYTYTAPAETGDGWLTSTAAAEGLDADGLDSLMQTIATRGDDEFLRNILIVRNNRLVFEEYFGGTGRNTLSHLQSATKSVVSAIYGIAETGGFVGAGGSALFPYFPEYAHLSTADKEQILVDHVLTMTPGFDWNESSAPTFADQNDNIAAYAANDYVGYVLAKDLAAPPGTEWKYNSGCPMLLAGIIRNQTGLHLDDFGDIYLFEPLGIEDRRWEYQSDGLPLATGGLWLRARDAAKIGQLFLDGGQWHGQQLISADWVERSLTAHVSTGDGKQYGYLWLTRVRAALRLWYAAGYGGQLIVIVPERAAVIVVNANYNRDTDEVNRRSNAVWSLLTTDILPAL